MATNRSDATVLETLILLEPGWEESWDSLLAAITAKGGQIVLAFRPTALITLLHVAVASALSDSPGVLVTTEAIAENDAGALPQGLRPAVTMWNERVARREGRVTRTGESLAWDAAGFLPPDPPPEILARLRRQEQEGTEDIE